MLEVKNLKRRGKEAFYHNWKSCVIICFIFTVLVGGTVFSVNREFDFDYLDNIEAIKSVDGENNSEIVNEFLNGIRGSEVKDNTVLNRATKGVIGTILNNVSKSGSYLFGFLNAVNEFLFKDHIWASFIIIIGATISLFYSIFVSKVVEVGASRFFLENRVYTKTSAKKLMIPYKLNKTTHIAYTMFLKSLYTLLWSFTIVGGVIKYFSYMMVPYVLAENPNIKPKDALKLSEDLMKGYKWSYFKLYLSFIGWYILGIITFNISNIVFTKPYLNATKAEVYMHLRNLAKVKGVNNAKMLSDNLLDGNVVDSEYPMYEYMLKESKHHKWLDINYNRDYSLSNLILLFFVFAFVGWLWEVLLFLFSTGVFVNRGTLYGPWLPIYGAGCVIILVLLKPFRKNPFIYFVATMVVCGIIEYSTSVYLELVHHMSWWDYTGYFLNLNGRICLEGLMFFGIGGVIVTYVAAPIIADFLDKINKKLKVVLCIILVTIIAIDFYVSGKKPNTGEGITSGVVINSKLDKIKKP